MRQSIHTPEHAEFHLPLAGLGSRGLAYLIDLGALWFLLATLFFLSTVLQFDAWDWAVQNGLWARLLLAIGSFALMFGYFAVAEGRFQGQTLGKRLLQLRSVRVDGSHLGWNEALLRNLLRLVDGAGTLYMAGLFSMLLGRQQRRLGDWVAGTYVIRDEPVDLKTLVAAADPQLQAWIKAQLPEWQALQSEALALRQGNLPLSQIWDFEEKYRSASAQLRRAQGLWPGSDVHRFLQQLCASAYSVLYAPARWKLSDLARFYRSTYPQLVRSHRPWIFSAFALMSLGALSGALLVQWVPEVARSMIPEGVRDAMAQGRLWTDTVGSAPADAAAQIMTNNLRVTALAFALGISLGIGTAMVLLFNGFHLGSILAYLAGYGQAGGLLEFTAAHGPMELTVLFLAGGAGLRLGTSLIAASDLSRTENLKAAALPAFQMMLGSLPFLAAIAWVEGFVSPGSLFPTWAKTALGAGLWLAYLLYVSRMGLAPDKTGVPALDMRECRFEAHMTERMAFLGAGNMAEALIRGLLRGGKRPEEIVATVRRADRRAELEKTYGISVGTDNAAACLGADTVVLCVKPQALRALLKKLAPSLTRDQRVISVAAGVPMAALEAQLPMVRLVRAMPNTPALVGLGATALAAGTHATEQDMAAAQALFNSVGITVVLEENQLDAVTGLSGSGPAYIFLIIEALSDAGVKVGLSRNVALKLAAQTVLGSAQLLISTNEHPGKLRDQVTSPGGTAIAGLHTLESGGLRTTLMDAVEAATRRAQQLGEQFFAVVNAVMS